MTNFIENLFQNSFREDEIEAFKFGGQKFIEKRLQSKIKKDGLSTTLRPLVNKFLTFILSAHNNNISKVADEIYKLVISVN